MSYSGFTLWSIGLMGVLYGWGFKVIIHDMGLMLVIATHYFICFFALRYSVKTVAYCMLNSQTRVMVRCSSDCFIAIKRV